MDDAPRDVLLCLHGSQQTGEILRSRLGNIVKKARKNTDVVFIDAPHASPVKPGDEVALRHWWDRRDSPAALKRSLEQSLAVVDSVWRDKAPVGVLGFSAGGSLAALIAMMPKRFPGLKYVVCAGAPDVDDLARACGAVTEVPRSVRSLHAAGTTDLVVPVVSSQALARRFADPIVVMHDQGHCMPSKADFVAKVVEFIELGGHAPPPPVTPSPGAANTTLPPQPPQPCSSAENAEQQRDELEALLSIYADADLKLIRAAPSAPEDPSAAFSIALDVSAAADGVPTSWAGRLRLVLDFAPSYPDAEPVSVDVDTGGLSMMDFPSAVRRSLLAAVRAAATAGVGAPSAFACIQAAGEWLAEGQWRAANGGDDGGAARGAGSGGGSGGGAAGGAGEASSAAAAQVADAAPLTLMATINRYEGQAHRLTDAEVEAEEVRETQHVQAATEEACKCAAANRANAPGGFADGGWDDQGDEEEDEAGGVGEDCVQAATDETVSAPSASARGVWNFVIGLVGKPSAGKSTFYNAATRAILRGRKMAEVAPHPFTTIEPNVGPGWYMGPADDDAGGRATAHGRDWLGTGRRLLPAIIKDVAGLVPGAYKGRGKVAGGVGRVASPPLNVLTLPFFPLPSPPRLLPMTGQQVLERSDGRGRVDPRGGRDGACRP